MYGSRNKNVKQSETLSKQLTRRGVVGVTVGLSVWKHTKGSQENRRQLLRV